MRELPAGHRYVSTVLALSLLACGSTTTVIEPAEPPTPPNTPAGQQLSWVLDVLNGAPLNAAALQAHFDASFLAIVPVEELQAQFEILAEEGPYRLDAIESARDTSLSVFVSPAPGEGAGTGEAAAPHGLPLRMDLATTDAPPYPIAALGLRPAPYRDPTLPQGWPAIEAALGQIAPTTSLYAAEITSGECRPIHAAAATRLLPIGSAFKLYVLGALVEAVAEGRASWEDVLPVDPALRSPSSLRLRELPDNHPLTLREHAEPMISVSDNTATDQLILHLGRDRVEAVQARMGHSHPDANMPFLTTREMMAIKLIFSYGQRQSYVNADVAGRRALLEEAGEANIGSLLWAASLWVAPRLADQVEWFASGEDLCRAMLSLRNMSETDAGEPVRAILSANPGIAFNPSDWEWVGYKGGSEPGVLNFTWMLQRTDDRWYVLVLTFLDTEEDIDLEAAIRLAAAAQNELARTP